MAGVSARREKEKVSSTAGTQARRVKEYHAVYNVSSFRQAKSKLTGFIVPESKNIVR